MKHLILPALLFFLTLAAVGRAQEPPADPPPADPPPAAPSGGAAQTEEEAKEAEAAREALRKLPWFKREPFYELYWQENKSDPIEKARIFPLKDIPKTPKEAEFLKLKLYDHENSAVHGQEFQVLWRYVVKISRFPEALLEKAESLAVEKKFDEAFYYYEFLRQRYPDDSYRYYENRKDDDPDKSKTLNASTANYFYLEAVEMLAKAEHDRAFTLLNDAYALNPEQPGLEDALARSAGERIARYVDKSRFDLARTALALLEQRYPNNATVVQWKNRLTAEAGKLLAQAEQHRQAGRLHEARETAFSAVDIWPLAEANAFLEDINRESPRVVVGVTSLPSQFDPAVIDDWASRRAGRLVHRMLLEFSRQGPEGGVYVCPFGEVQKLPLDNLLVIHLNRGVKFTGADVELTGADAARHLVAMSDALAPHDPGRDVYNPRWEDVFGGADLPRENTVEIRFRRSHVHPDGFLQTKLVPWDDIDPADANWPSIGPYHVVADQQTPGEVRYRSNPQYFAAGPQQPKEIVERYFQDGREAFKALRTGRIAVLDRVNPWNVGDVRGYDFLEAKPYSHPTLHVLRVNPNNPLFKRRIMRRAIVHAIDRNEILKKLLGGPLVAGNQVLAAPFPAELDPTLKPQPSQPALAYTLKNVAIAQENAVRKERMEKLLDDENVELVLAHPADDLARVAGRAIKDQLQVIGINVSLVEVPPGQRLDSVQYDLAYTELAVLEPLLDARRLFGADGLAGNSSAYMRLALRDLDEAADWRTARAQLLEINRLAAQDLPMLPLWQITDHYAYNKALVGLSDNPLTLYQNVETWESPPAVLPRE